MDPVAFKIGSHEVYWYGIILAFATLIGIILAYFEAERKGVDPNQILDIAIFAIPVAVIFARAYYVIFNLEYYLKNPKEIFAVWHGGIAIHGTILGGVLVVFVMSRIRKLKFVKLLDIFAPSLILGQAIGRWGNFVNQEAYGYETNLPWAMYIDGAYRHPTFLYESLWNLAVFLLLLKYKKLNHPDGRIFSVYAVFYSIGRFIVEGFRTDSLMFGEIRVAQLVSVLVVIGGLLILYLQGRNHKISIDSNGVSSPPES